MRLPWLALAAWGCGSSGDDQPDARILVVGSVTVVVTQVGVPIVDAPVRFVQPTGAPVQVRTDAAGMATAEVQTGSSVTVVALPVGAAVPAQTFVYTTMGLAPGDVVRFTEPAPAPTAGAPVDVAFTPTNLGSPTLVRARCAAVDAPSGATTATLTGVCTDVDSPVLALQVDGASVTGYGLLPPQALAGGAVTVPDPWRAPELAGLRVVGVPADVAVSGFTFEEALGDRALYTTGLVGPLVPVGGVLDAGIGIAAVGTARRADFAMTRAADPSALQVWSLRGDLGSRQVNVADGTSLLPWLSAPTWDPATRQVAWVEAGGNAAAVTARWIRRTFATSGGQAEWAVLAPAGATTAVVFPELPTDAPITEGAESGAPKVTHYGSSASYDDLRADFVADLRSPLGELALPGTQLLRSQVTP